MKTIATAIIGGLLLVLTGCAALETAVAPRVGQAIDRYCAEPETARQTLRDAVDRHTEHKVRIECVDGSAALGDVNGSDLVGELITGHRPGDVVSVALVCPSLDSALTDARARMARSCRTAPGPWVLLGHVAGPVRDVDRKLWSVWVLGGYGVQRYALVSARDGPHVRALEV